ncbi:MULTISPECIES: hypothetical protein [unclassified Pseudomonas]|jgi:hypothetical protein|uniref:hypothetical protein n=1 Tax=unclassified Pseudomonas TaxID=196821 RepID=UPI0011AF5AD5|nr:MULTISPECIES: hypothetical protein [unclassified Pseudomonas]
MNLAQAPVFQARSSTGLHPALTQNSNVYGPEKLDLNCEVGMSIDSSFEDRTQGSVPSKPEPGSEEPQRPDDPGQPDPLKRPKDERPEDWRDPAERNMPEADEETSSADNMR